MAGVLNWYNLRVFHRLYIYSEEIYRLDDNGEEVRVAITINLPDGNNVSLVKYLSRCADVGFSGGLGV